MFLNNNRIGVHLTFFCWDNTCSNKSNKLITLTASSTTVNSCPRHNVAAIYNIKEELGLISENIILMSKVANAFMNGEKNNILKLKIDNTWEFIR